MLPRTIIQLYYTNFKNSRLVGAKMPLSLLYREPKCTSTVYRTCFRLDGNGRPYRRSAGCERNQKCPYVSKVCTEHTQGKMRHLKPVCVTEMDVTTTERISPFFISRRRFLAGLRPFYTAGSRLSMQNLYLFL